MDVLDDQEKGFRRLSRLGSFRLGVILGAFGLSANALVLIVTKVLSLSVAWDQMARYPDGNDAPVVAFPPAFVDQLRAVWSHDALFVITSVLGPVVFFAGLLFLSRPWGAWARREGRGARAFARGATIAGIGFVCLVHSLFAILYACILS